MGVPIVLEEIPRNSRETIRLELNTYAGEQVLCIRKYYSPDGGVSWLPTREGVNMQLKNWRKILPTISESLREDVIQ
jgi:hypothetical protein